MSKIIGIIEFKEKTYELHAFKYFSKRDGILMVDRNNDKNAFNATLDIDKVGVNENQIILKDHDFNEGLLVAMLQNKIIKKQYRSITFGFNKVHICNLR